MPDVLQALVNLQNDTKYQTAATTFASAEAIKLNLTGKELNALKTAQMTDLYRLTILKERLPAQNSQKAFSTLIELAEGKYGLQYGRFAIYQLANIYQDKLISNNKCPDISGNLYNFCGTLESIEKDFNNKTGHITLESKMRSSDGKLTSTTLQTILKSIKDDVHASKINSGTNTPTTLSKTEVTPSLVQWAAKIASEAAQKVASITSTIPEEQKPLRGFSSRKSMSNFATFAGKDSSSRESSEGLGGMW